MDYCQDAVATIDTISLSADSILFLVSHTSGYKAIGGLVSLRILCSILNYEARGFVVERNINNTIIHNVRAGVNNNIAAIIVDIRTYV